MKPLQVLAKQKYQVKIFLSQCHRIANKLNNWEKKLYDMPPEKEKESQKGRNRIKESQKGRKRNGPGCLQSQLKTQKRKELCKFQKNEKFSFFLFLVYATGLYRAPVRCSKSQYVKLWIAEPQVKQGVRRYKL